MRLPVRAVSSVRPASSPAPAERAGPSGLQLDDRLSDVAQRLERSLETSIAVAREPEAEALTEAASASASASPAAPAVMRDAQGREIILAPGETLDSEWPHRAWVAAGFGVMGALFAAGAVRVHDAPSAAAAAAAVVSAYVFAGACSCETSSTAMHTRSAIPCVRRQHACTHLCHTLLSSAMLRKHCARIICCLLCCCFADSTYRLRGGADLLSGVYHWGVDNYGDGDTPVFGSQIAGFQVRLHHEP